MIYLEWWVATSGKKTPDHHKKGFLGHLNIVYWTFRQSHSDVEIFFLKELEKHPLLE